MMAPPSSGPARPAIPQTAPKIPCMRPRSRTSKRSPTMVRAIGWMAPAPSPCTARAATSWPIEPARPQALEPRRKSVRPKSITGLRPFRSASFP